MDIFGIRQAMQGIALTYFISARHTGRTLSMIGALKEGDRVCFLNEGEARRVKAMCKERGFEIETEIIDPKYPNKIFEKGTVKGRYVFDHSWVEQYYMNAINKAGEDIEYFQKQKSGFGEAHLETRRKATELHKWDV